MTRLSSAIVTHRGRILLFLRDGRPLRDPNRWSLIGGHVENGESFDAAVVREVEEEIGIRPQRYRFLLGLPGYWDEDIALFHVPLSDEDASRIRLGNEGQSITFFEVEELAGLPLTANLTMIFSEHRERFIDAVTSEHVRCATNAPYSSH